MAEVVLFYVQGDAKFGDVKLFEGGVLEMDNWITCENPFILLECGECAECVAKKELIQKNCRDKIMEEFFEKFMTQPRRDKKDTKS